MALTPELVALVERPMPDLGPHPGLTELTDADYDALGETLLNRHRPAHLWVFAYGSLIWKPEFTSVEHRRATAYGWHRSFCLELTSWRGTPEQPGLMLCLDHGGSCHGIVYRLEDEDHFAQLGRLLRRETTYKEDTDTVRWIDVATQAGKLRALSFWTGYKGDGYTGKLPPEKVARTLARACGHVGSCANYLYQTVTKLDEHGIRDSHLWHLQELVAEEIRREKVGGG